MKRNFRTKNYTSRVKPISLNEINRLRNTQLKKASSASQIRFLKSKQFDKRIRQNIRENRIKKNVQAISKIGKTVKDPSQRRNLETFFKEKTAIRGGKVVKVNTLTSYKQTQRLQKITKQISQNKFKASTYVTKTKRFREIKKFLPKKVSQAEMLVALDRTNFYFENKKKIMEHNANVEKHGFIQAQKMKAGREVEEKYYESLENENREVIEGLVK